MLGITKEELQNSIQKLQNALGELLEKLSVSSDELTFEETHEHLKSMRNAMSTARDLLNKALHE